MTEEELLTLEDIMDIKTWTVKIPESGKVVTVKVPTVDDRIQVLAEAKKDPRWKDFNEDERTALMLDLLVLKMIIEPKISLKNYYKADSIKMFEVIRAVLNDYMKRYGTKTQARAMARFLEPEKASNQ
jgi:hypothetical protein